MKRLAVGSVVALLLLSPYAVAQDKATDGGAAVAAAESKPASEAKNDNSVENAEKLVDDNIKKIDENPGEAVSELIQLAKEGRWGSFVGLALMFLIWILRRFIWQLIPKNALPWVTLGIGMVVTGAIELGLGVSWWKVLIDAFAASSVAMGFWSLLFKHVLKVEKKNS